MQGDETSEGKIKQIAMQIWMDSQAKGKQAWLDYNLRLNLRCPSSREVDGEVIGTYYKPILDDVEEDVRETVRIINAAV